MLEVKTRIQSNSWTGWPDSGPNRGDMGALPRDDRWSSGKVWRWLDETILDLGRQLRFSYLPPLMVYLAAGVSSSQMSAALERAD